jgi:hypothetical protein
VTQEQNFINPELALAQLCVQLVLSQPLQYHLQMIRMLFLLTNCSGDFAADAGGTASETAVEAGTDFA